MLRKNIIKGLLDKSKVRDIAKNAECGVATVLRVKTALEDRNISLEEANKISEEDLEALFNRPRRTPDEFAPIDFNEVLHRLNRAKYPQSLRQCWEQYMKTGHESLKLMSYKSFCKRFKAFRAELDEETKLQESGKKIWTAGQAVMVDYSGDGLPAVIGGKEVVLQVFVAVLPYSSYTFAYATIDQSRDSWLIAMRNLFDFLEGVPKYIVLDNSTTCVVTASKVLPRYAKKFELFCRYYRTQPYAGEPHVPLVKPHVERAVGLVQQKILSELVDEMPCRTVKEANERLLTKIIEFNNRPLSIDPTQTRKSFFESAEKDYLRPTPFIPWGDDVEHKVLKVQRGGTVRFNGRRYRVDYHYAGHFVNVIAQEKENKIQFFSEQQWKFLGELELKSTHHTYVDDVSKQGPGSRFMQAKPPELLKDVDSAGPCASALCRKLLAMDDELASARYCRFIKKMHSSLGAERFENVLFNTREFDGI